jgi:hypothetical protein
MRGAQIEAEHNTQKKPTPAHAAGPERTGLDSEWCAVKAAEALRYLALHYPECAGSEALHPHQDAAHAAAVAGDEAAYLEALRGYCRAGRSVALVKRRGAA